MKAVNLFKIAKEAKRMAYAPYSKFKVGAALLTTDGSIFTGANIENSSYGLTVCAERIAIFKAVLEGYRQFQALAVAGSGSGYTYPCGACLQVLAEFSSGTKIITANENDEIREYYLDELLPQIFRLKQEDLAGASYLLADNEKIAE